MNLAHIFTDPPILVVIFAFISAMTYCTVKYTQVKKNLNILYQFTSNFKKSDLNYRFKEIDEWMSLNPYVSGIWLEFKNTLVFSESVALKGQNNSLTYKEVSSTIQNIQTTVDPAYFFNEESLVTGKFNNKLMVSWPTILTGLGPLFTFLNIAIAFGKIDFSSQEATIASVANLMSSMQIAALVSVFALCASLIFIVYEKFAYAILCHGPFSRVIGVIGKLFDNISSEKFLLELLKETKIQNNALQHLITELPNHFKVALNSGIAGNLVPYLENLIFGMNLMNKQMKEMAKATKSDAVDDLF